MRTLTVSPEPSNSDPDKDEYGKLKRELADVKKDYLNELDSSLTLEQTLIKADGKVVLISGVLRQAYNTIAYLNEGLNSSILMAKSLLKECKDLPAISRKEAESVLAYRKATGFSIKAFNKALKNCFI